MCTFRLIIVTKTNENKHIRYKKWVWICFFAKIFGLNLNNT